MVAAGRGSRMGGGEKALLRLGAGTLLDAVIDKVRPQVETLALNVRSDAAPRYRLWRQRGFPLIEDAFGGDAGPLGGVVAGLEWLASNTQENDWLATFPCDTPFLPDRLVATLAAAAAVQARPAVALDGERIQSLCALWPLTCLPRLRAGMESGHMRSVWRALVALDAVRCPAGRPGDFFNINTPDDLAQAERLFYG